MKSKLYFEILLDHDRKAYGPLRALGEYRYCKQKRKYNWIFPLCEVKEVIAVLGKPIRFDHEDVNQAVILSEERKQKIEVDEKQGKGFIRVSLHPEKPNAFLVTTVRERTPQNTIVSFETVNLTAEKSPCESWEMRG